MGDSKKPLTSPAPTLAYSCFEIDISDVGINTCDHFTPSFAYDVTRVNIASREDRPNFILVKHEELGV